MAIITAAGLINKNELIRTFNKNGSVVTLKKISETDWLLFGDLAEGSSRGFEASLVCESRTTWDGPGASFGIKAWETFWAADSYGFGVHAFFAYDSQGIKEQTGEFTTPIPDGIEWIVVGFNPDGGLIIVLKELEGTPVLSGAGQLSIGVTDGFNEVTLIAYRNSSLSIFHAGPYDATIFPATGDTLCIQASPSGTP